MSEGPGATSPNNTQNDLSMLGRSDALRKLVGKDFASSQGSTTMASSSPASSAPPQAPHTSFNSPRNDKPYDFNAIKANVPGSRNAPSKGEPISLAAFMGSSASGPRLNKAPKQEAYNPELYASRPDISGPHPIFGRAREQFEKGKPMHAPVPLPGMVRRTSPIPPPEPVKQEEPEDDWKPKPVEALSVGRKSGDYQPSVDKSRRFSDDWEPKVPQQSVQSFTPVKAEPHTPVVQPATPVRSVTTYDEFGSPTSTRANVTSDTSPTISKTVSAPPALARSIQPSPKPSVSPQVAVSTRQSPAFLKPVQQKDLTPSLSKLQGRGFVAQRISASNVMDSSKDQGVSSPMRKSGVLSRWPPAANDAPVLSPTTPDSPTRSRAISQIERDREAGIFPGTSAPPPQRQQSQPRLGPGAVPLPAMAKTKSPTAPASMYKTPEPSYEPPAPPIVLPGLAASGARGPSKSPAPVSSPVPVPQSTSYPPAPEIKSQRTGPGSATTMISFIRPQKTGQSEKSVHLERDRERDQDDDWEVQGGTSKFVEPTSTSASVLSHVREPYQTLSRSSRA